MTEVMLGKPPELVVNSYFAPAVHRGRNAAVRALLPLRHRPGAALHQAHCQCVGASRAREEGRSGYTISKLLNLWMNGFTSFSVKPLRLATYAGTVFAGFGFLYLIYIIIDTSSAAPLLWVGRLPRRCCCCWAA